MSKTAFKALETQGTYFQLYDYGHLSSEDDVSFSERLTLEYKVATIPVSAFYAQKIKEQKLIRFCFAKTDDSLVEAARRLKHFKK